MLNFVLVAGSSRANSQSAKVAEFLRQRLIEQGHSSAAHCSVINLGAGPLPLWPSDDSGPWPQYAEQLKNADAVVIVTEWDAFRALDLARLGAGMTDKLLVDLRNIYRRDAVARHGFRHIAIGTSGE